MKELTRYLAGQLVGWIGLGLLVAWLVAGLGLPSWLWLVLVAFIVKDLVLLPAIRRSWGPPRAGPATLIGARGVAIEPLAPAGQVRVGAEIWAAETADPGRSIAPGRAVAIRARRGAVLLVAEVEGGETSSPRPPAGARDDREGER
jgi:membrane-bound ClpP family serine protease